MKFNHVVLCSILACLSLGACESLPPAISQPSAPGLASYRLGPGDKLRITVFDEEKLTGEYEVTDNGTVSFPLIGNVPASGEPLSSLQEVIRTRLGAGYVKDPRVAVEVLTYRPYYVLGEVNRPGQYPFVVGMRLDQAVAAAGGYTYRANMRKAFLRRAEDSSEKTVDMRRQNIAIMPGDTLRIGYRYF